MARPVSMLGFAAAMAAAWPAPAFADPSITTAEGAIAAYEAQVDEVMAGVARVRRCPVRAEGDEIVVCAPGDDGRLRIPYVPVPGSIHRVAGETPTGGDAMAAERCLRLCNQGLRIDVIGAARAIGRGVDRILHPD